MTELPSPDRPPVAAPASAPGGPVYVAPRGWTRLHPVSPLLKAWPAVLGVGAFWYYTAGPSWLGGGEDNEEIPSFLRLSAIALAGVAVLLMVIAAAVAYVQWRFARYRITDDALEFHKGIVFRQQRHARLDRLQAVDVVQPLVARIFGFAKVSIEVAGGEDSSVQLEFLRLGDAEALRNEILALAAGRRVARQDAASGTDAPVPVAPKPALSPADVNPLSLGEVRTEVEAEPEREVYSVPLSRLALSLLRSSGAIAAGLMAPVIVGLAVAATRSNDVREVLLGVIGGSVAGLVGAVGGVFAYTFSQVNKGFGFKAAVAGDGIRLRHGLVETRRQTVPPGRVQAVRMRQTLLWRGKDWWAMTINVAGYQQNQEAVSTLLPVGPREEAELALRLVFPRIAHDLMDPDAAPAASDDLPSVLAAAMEGTGGEGGFIASPPSARWLDPWQWRRRGVAATEDALIIRRGRITREVFVVPHERTQSLKLEQGPLQRMLGLASVVVHSTQGAVKPAAHHLAVADALRLLDEQAERARRRRKVQTPEQWAREVEALGIVAVGAENGGDAS